RVGVARTRQLAVVLLVIILLLPVLLLPILRLDILPLAIGLLPILLLERRLTCVLRGVHVVLARLAPRDRRRARRRRASQDHGGVQHAFLLDQGIELLGIGGQKPHAAMRGRRAEMLHVIAAVDRVTLLGEEDRERHRGVVPFLGEVILLHAERLVLAARGFVAGGGPAG